MALLKWTFILADVILVGLFIAGFAAKYVHPRYAWWLQLVALGLPIFALGVVIVSSTALVMGRWYVFAAHVPLLILVALRFFPASWWSSSAAPSDDGLVFVSANVKDKFPDGGSIIPSLPQGRTPDVFAAQEAAIVSVREGIGAAGHVFPLVLEYQTCPSSNADSSRRDRIENPIFTKLPCVEMTEVRSVATLNGRNPVMLTRGVLIWRGRKFALYNIHLRSFSIPDSVRAEPLRGFFTREQQNHLRRDFLIRADEAETLRRMLDAESLPYILCGDFNSTQHQWSYAHLARGLTDAFTKAGRGRRATFHSRLPLISIDHFLVSPHWNVIAARTGEASVSDHLPLIVEVKWRRRATPESTRAEIPVSEGGPN